MRGGEGGGEGEGEEEIDKQHGLHGRGGPRLPSPPNSPACPVFQSPVHFLPFPAHSPACTLLALATPSCLTAYIPFCPPPARRLSICLHARLPAPFSAPCQPACTTRVSLPRVLAVPSGGQGWDTVRKEVGPPGCNSPPAKMVGAVYLLEAAAQEVHEIATHGKQQQSAIEVKHGSRATGNGQAVVNDPAQKRPLVAMVSLRAWGGVWGGGSCCRGNMCMLLSAGMVGLWRSWWWRHDKGERGEGQR